MWGPVSIIKSFHFQDLHNPPTIFCFSIIVTSHLASRSLQAVIKPVGPAPKIIAFLFLECINYIEHYGLRRFKNESGRYERVQSYHSWNSNHSIGRIVLYELTRHSDHHFKSSKKYQLLDCHDDSPQLPYGYPASILLSFVPPLWFSIMNPLVPERMKKI